MNRSPTLPKLSLLLATLWLLGPACEPWDLTPQEFVRVRLLSAEATGLTTATLTAEALDQRLSSITDHGFVWSLSEEVPNLLFNDGLLSLGVKEVGENPAFQATLSGLIPDTTYLVVAYAVAGGEEIYSEAAAFTTGGGTVVTRGFVYERRRSMELSGSITGAEAGIQALSHGFVWSNTSPEPTLDDYYVDLGNRRTGLPFTYTLDSLQHRTPLYLRAYARLLTNGRLRTAYGGVLRFDGMLREIWEPVPELTALLQGRYLFTLHGRAYFADDGRLGEYDPQQQSWNWRAPLNDIQPQYFFAIDDKGYVVEYPEREGRTWEYDPLQDQWTEYAALPNADLLEATAGSVGGKGYIGTGFDEVSIINSPPMGTGEWWELDPAQRCGPDSSTLPGCWMQRADFPGLIRFSARNFTLEGRIYVGMGSSYLDDRGIDFEHVDYQDWWAWDPQTAQWSAVAPLEDAESCSSASFTIDGRAYVLCRLRSSTSALFSYDPITDVWQAGLASPAPMTYGFSLGQSAYMVRLSLDGTEVWQYIP